MKLRHLAVLGLALSVTGCSLLINPDKKEFATSGDGGIGRDAHLDAGIDAAPDTGQTDGALADATQDSATDAAIDSGLDAGSVDGGRSDAGPFCAESCDDGLDCTLDTCRSEGCVNTPDNALCGPGGLCFEVLGCVVVPLGCTSDADCSDGAFCNGVEKCDPLSPGGDKRGCIPGEEPCSDEITCTVASCNEISDRCTQSNDDSVCRDSFDCTIDVCDPTDGSADRRTGCVRLADDSVCDTSFCRTGSECDLRRGCVGGGIRDCNDGTPCTTDSCNETERMCVHTAVDADSDGFAAGSRGGVSCGGSDCNDSNPAVRPGALELCNGTDDNCNGTTDEGCASVPDACDSAAAIALVAGHGSVSGNFADFSNSFTTSCSGGPARDAVYYFDITTASDVRVMLTASDPDADVVVAVGVTCGSDAFANTCNDDYDPGETVDSRVWLHRVQPLFLSGSLRLYVLVDATNSDTDVGAFTLNIDVTPVGGDTCGGDPLDISGGGTVVGVMPFLSFGGGDQRGSCQSDGERSEREDVLQFRSEGSQAHFSAISLDFAPDLYVRETCDDSDTELACRRGMTSRTNEISPSLEAGSTNYLIVDGWGMTSIGSTAGYRVVYDPR